MNILQAKISRPEEDLSLKNNVNEFNEHGEAAEMDDFLAFNISDDIFHCDINEIKKSMKLILTEDRKYLREVK